MTTPEKPVRLPLYLSITEASRILGWSFGTTRRWAEGFGLLVNFGYRDMISFSKLKAAFPQVYEEILEEIEE